MSGVYLVIPMILGAVVLLVLFNIKASKNLDLLKHSLKVNSKEFSGDFKDFSNLHDLSLDFFTSGHKVSIKSVVTKKKKYTNKYAIKVSSHSHSKILPVKIACSPEILKETIIEVSKK